MTTDCAINNECEAANAVIMMSNVLCVGARTFFSVQYTVGDLRNSKINCKSVITDSQNMGKRNNKRIEKLKMAK
jgi:hypothetical protein